MSESPRILQIFNDYLEPGGEKAAVEYISEALSRVYPVERCTFSSHAWKGAGAPPAWKQAMWMMRNPASIAHLREMHASRKTNLWLVNNVFPVGSAGIFQEALKLGVPILYYIHNFRPFSVNGYLWAGDALAPGGLKRGFWKEIANGAWQNSKIKTAWFAMVLHAAHRLGWFKAIKGWIAISDFMRQSFIQAGVPGDQIFTVPHFWRPSPEPVWKDDGYFLFLGRLITEKGLEVLLRAWDYVEETLGQNAPRLFIAGGGPLEEEMRERCDEMRCVRFLGYVTGARKQELISGCSAMIAPSIWWEPFGLVTYEAYDQAKPMLAARSGGLIETVVDGKTGFLHEPGNARQLAEQVIRLHRERELRREMGQAGRAWLLEHGSESLWMTRMQRAISYAIESKS